MPDSLCYSVSEDGILRGALQFSLKPENAVIYNMGFVAGYEPDVGIIMVLGRAALNFIDLSGVHSALFIPGEKLTPEQERYALIIGFKRSDIGWHVDLNGFFDHPCQHSAEK